MGWFGKLTFGTMGMFFGGPIGAIAGAALGHHLVDKDAEQGNKPPKIGYTEQTQASYFVSIFSTPAASKIARAGPPAIIPVPGVAGRSIMRLARNLPIIS